MRALRTVSASALAALALAWGFGGGAVPVLADSPTPEPTYSQDLFQFGHDIHLGPTESVGRDVTCIGCSVTIDGATVGRDVFAIGGNVTLTGAASVGRDVTAVGGNVNLGPSTSVVRDVQAVGGNANVAPGAHVGRNVGSQRNMPFAHMPNAAGLLFFGSFFQIVPAMIFLLLAMLLLVLFPRQLEAARLVLARNVPGTFGLGCLGMIAAVALAALFAVTVILIPVSLVLVLVLAAAWLFGWATIYLALGRRLLPNRRDPLTALLLGGAILGLLSLIPVVNFLVAIFGGCVAVGAALGSRFGHRGPGDRLFPTGPSWGPPPGWPAGPSSGPPATQPPAPPPPPAPGGPPAPPG